MFADAMQQLLNFIKRGAQRSILAHNFHHRINVTIHPVNDAPELIPHGNCLAFSFVSSNFGENRAVRLVQVGLDAAKRLLDFFQSQPHDSNVITINCA